MQNIPSGPTDTPGRVPDPTRSAYAEEAAVQDRLLDEKIVRIRAQVDLGTLTIREAADARVVVYTHHLAAVHALNEEYFGGTS